MAKAGRKRKTGMRTKTGRLSRAGVCPYDKGTERAQLMRTLYGDNWADPIGRAFAAGLLGQPDEAKPLLDYARSIHAAYWMAYATVPVGSALRNAGSSRTTGADVISMDCERAKRREMWLNEDLRCVCAMGVRREFDALVIDVNPDSGPDWLDRLIYDKRTGKQTASDRDHAAFRAALDALETISGVTE
ncbi:MAG: hypothetical protein EON59_05685 [Alphaproteobacteria bacterium]|nr:MAG: hypothetical protein EON59_05685 [Alphaproteobacteria bacterium]